MPYITTETVKEIRQQIKKAFPEFKMSVTRRHHSTVCVAIMSGPASFDKDHQQINHFYVEDHYSDQPEMLKVFKGILDIISNVHPNRTVVEDADYGSVPEYYISLDVGKWDKPYQQK